jgi:hypothetical protein
MQAVAEANNKGIPMKRMQFLALVAATLLSACGGGDGGSDNISFDRGGLMFTGAFGTTIPSQKVSVNVGLGTGSTQRYVGVDNKTPSLVSVNYNVTHIDAFTVTLTPVPGLARGTYNSSIDVLVCSDVACNKVVDRAVFTYTIVIS